MNDRLRSTLLLFAMAAACWMGRIAASGDPLDSAAFGQEAARQKSKTDVRSPDSEPQRKSDRLLAEPPDRAPRPAPLSEEREQLLMEFVRQHHPEVTNLLVLLKSRHDAQYRRAMSELNRVYDRLATLKERDPERYQLDLEAWQIKSRIDLLTARMARNDSGVDESDIRTALARQLDVRRRQLQLERDRLRQRIERIETQLQSIDQQNEQEIDRQLAAIQRGIKRFQQQTSELNKRSDGNAENRRADKKGG